jgi:hypothetical protein
MEYLLRKMLFALQVYNMSTTPLYMGVGPSVLGPPPCEGVLCSCCALEVQIISLICWREGYQRRGDMWQTIIGKFTMKGDKH